MGDFFSGIGDAIGGLFDSGASAATDAATSTPTLGEAFNPADFTSTAAEDPVPTSSGFNGLPSSAFGDNGGLTAAGTTDTGIFSGDAAAGSGFTGTGGSGLFGSGISPGAALLAGSGIQGLSGILGSQLASSAQQAAAQRAAALGQNIWGTIQGNLAPFIGAGTAALNPLTQLATGSPEQISAALQNLPGYNFTQTQGLKAVQNSASARGLGVSGAAQKGAASYATGLANSTFGDQFNRLLNLASLGSNAGALQGNLGVQSAQGIGNNLVQAGNANAAGTLGTTGAINGGVGNAQQLLTLNALLSGINGGGGQNSGLFGS